MFDKFEILSPINWTPTKELPILYFYVVIVSQDMPIVNNKYTTSCFFATFFRIFKNVYIFKNFLTFLGSLLGFLLETLRKQ
jgi:hypothetical protein